MASALKEVLDYSGGLLLPAPVTHKETANGENSAVEFGLAAMQGWRASMEDAHIADLGLGAEGNLALLSIFDGHGGPAVSRFCARHLVQELAGTPAYQGGNLRDALYEAYCRLDVLIASEEGAQELRRLTQDADNGSQACPPDALGAQDLLSLAVDKAGGLAGRHPAWHMGCTGLSVAVRGDTITVANAGDSRCVLSRAGRAVALTFDHKPVLFSESRRITQAGGWLEEGRINGLLNVSRALGDLAFKSNLEKGPDQQLVIAAPDVQSYQLRDEDDFLVLACDGIWDVMSNQEAVDFVRVRLSQGLPLPDICDALCEACLAPSLQEAKSRGGDNMTVAVVVFLKAPAPQPWWSGIAANVSYLLSLE